MILCIDGKGLAYRCFHAATRGGYGRPDTGAVDAWQGAVKKYLAAVGATSWVSAWESGSTFRSELFPAYKATRKPERNEIYGQLATIKRWCTDHGMLCLHAVGYEGDDVIATVCRAAMAADEPVTIVSDDKDMLQLVRPSVRLLRPARWPKGRHAVGLVYGPADVFREWGVPPEWIPDVLAIMGDSSDNVPGVPGIGEKGAQEIIAETGGLEQAITAAAISDTWKWSETKRRALLAHASGARLSLRLVQLATVQDGFGPKPWSGVSARAFA